MYVVDHPTPCLFFTGKGGVGKTSLACATAVALADKGRRVLLVSTDPASNLEHVFTMDVGGRPTPVPGVAGLEVMNINPEAAARAYRERVIGPVRGVLPEDVVRGMEEQLSGACTTEIASFDQFTALLTDPARSAHYDHIIFDTAPTGHTLRLLSLPAAWTGFLDTNQSGASCLGPMSGLDAQRDQYREAVAALTDAARTMLVLVSRPDTAALAEADRTRTELAALGIKHQRLVVNGVFTAQDRGDLLALAFEGRARQAMEQMPAGLQTLPCEVVPLKPNNLVGLAALRGFLDARSSPAAVMPRADESLEATFPTLGELVDQIAAGDHGLIMVMGKGGVGKTTIAAAIAVGLASRGLRTHLTTTDPAAHVDSKVAGSIEHLRVSRIDPHAETESYRKHVMEQRGKDLDEQGRALLEEDLRSPCTEEVAVFHAFSRVVSEAGRSFVVMDTAPTGHTLLLLDATGAYHREVLRTFKPGAGRVTTPMMRLQDPSHTRIVIVTLPEITPVLEAERLQMDLRRAGIEPFGWVVNSSLAAAMPSDPLLIERAWAELPQIERVRSQLCKRLAVVPWLAKEPIGEGSLKAMTEFEASETVRIRA